MKIKTYILQEMVSKAIKGASNNKLIPITSFIGIETKENKLSLKTMDDENNILTITENVDLDPVYGPVSLYTVVNADTFSKLVAKTTSEFIELDVSNDCLIIKGNGTYKLEIPLDEDGNVIQFPKIEIDDSESVDVDVSELKYSINKAEASVAKTMEVPCLTGYYISDNVISTDRQMVSYVNKKLFEKPILISSRMAELLQLFDTKTVSVSIKDNSLLFKNDKIILSGKQLEGIEMYPVKALDNLMKLEYNNHMKVNKQELLNVLDRMSLFISDYDKNGVYITFDCNSNSSGIASGITLQSQKSNATETIKAEELEINQDFTFTCLVDIEMLKSQVQVNSTELVDIYYGQEKSIKIVDEDSIIVISLLDINN